MTLLQNVIASSPGSRAYSAYRMARQTAARLVAGRKRVNLVRGATIAASYGSTAHETFFGYYDLNPFHPSGTHILALQVARHDGHGGAGAADIQLYDVADFTGTPIKLAETQAWCWQQGCRLRWWDDSHILYNDLDSRTPISIVRSTRQNAEQTRFAMALYDVTPDQRFGLSLDFLRLQALRPGYGYAASPEYRVDHPAPANNGIWRVDLRNHAIDLLVSLQQVSRLQALPSMDGANHYFNHLSCSPDSRHALAFHVWDKGGKRQGRALLIDLQSGAIHIVPSEPHVSHYAWVDAATVLLTTTHPIRGFGYHLYSLAFGWGEHLLPKHRLDGHPSYNPRHPELLLTDTYPDRYAERSLLLHSPERGLQTIASFYSPPSLARERRCDLHPRWSPNGNLIAVDSAHDGFRKLLIIKPDLDV